MRTGMVGLLLVLTALILFAAFQFVYPGNPSGLHRPDDFVVLAHRGLHTNWRKGEYDLATGCEATHIYSPTHDYIENTLASIGAAYAAGATMVEVDIRPSKEGVLMLNHEENLACKTDGAGRIDDYTVEELKRLDVGYGFTHDGGATYPLRGKGAGAMPTLAEAFAAFPNQAFLLDHKDRRWETGELLARELRRLSPEQRGRVFYWGSPQIGDYIRGETPEVTRLLANRRELKQCLRRYMLSFGLAGFGDACENLGVTMSRAYAKYMWGFPYRFIRQAHINGSSVYLLVDSAEDIAWARNMPVDGVITDYIEVVGQEPW